MAGETSYAYEDVKLKGAVEAGVHHVQPISMVVPDQIIFSSYKECKRNHAASYGRHAVDGCGEFVCCGTDPYTCVACGCHRSFHRKDAPTAAAAAAAAVPVCPPTPTPFLSPMPLASHNRVTGETSVFIRDRNINIGAGGAGVKELGKDDKMRKRARRTTLTKEQKMEMTGFADKIGWRSRRSDAAEIHHFCDGIGITKRCFVIWLNNNKRGRKKNGSV